MRHIWNLAAGILCSTLFAAAQAAPIVVTPGSVAGYIYTPKSAGAGGGDAATLDAATCNVTKTFTNSVTFSTPGTTTWTVPNDIGCIGLEVAGAGGGGGGGGSAVYGASYSGSVGGNGGKGGDSYVQNSAGRLVSIGCGGGGGAGGPGAYSTGTSPLWVLNQSALSGGGGSGHVDKTPSIILSTYSLCAYFNQYSSTTIWIYSGGGAYPGVNGFNEVDCLAANPARTKSSKGGNGGSGYKYFSITTIKPGTTLTLNVGQGGGGGGGATTGAMGTAGTPNVTWYSAETYQCLENGQGALGGVGGAANANWWSSGPGGNGANGANGMIKIYY